MPARNPAACGLLVFRPAMSSVWSLYRFCKMPLIADRLDVHRPKDRLFGDLFSGAAVPGLSFLRRTETAMRRLSSMTGRCENDPVVLTESPSDTRLVQIV